MPLMRLKYRGKEYLGYPLWHENQAAYRVECGERSLGVVFGEDGVWDVVKRDRVVDLESVPPVPRSAPKMIRGVSID